MQIGRAYGTNRRSETPAHLYLTGLNTDGQLKIELERKMTGFGTDSCIVSLHYSDSCIVSLHYSDSCIVSHHYSDSCIVSVHYSDSCM